MRSDTKALVYKFGAFTFDPRTGDLKQNDLRIRINRQTSDLLSLLLAEPGKLITREQIKDVLWPQHELLNHDKVINNVVSRLRLIFRDDPRAPWFIERIPKRGYRLLTEVLEIYPIATPPDGPAEDFASINLDESVEVNLIEDLRDKTNESGPPLQMEAPLRAAALSRRRRHNVFWLIVATCVVLLFTLAIVRRKLVPPVGPPTLSLGLAPFETNGHEADELASSFRLDLTDALSQLPQVRMRAANSTGNLKRDSADLPKEAAKLGLDMVIFGRFTLEDKVCHLHLEIVRSKDATHVATMQYSGPKEQLVSIRDRLQQEIFSKLQLTGTEAHTVGNTTNPKAYEEYLSGRYHFSQQTNDALHQAVQSFQDALGNDPNFGRAYAGLGRTYLIMGIHNAMPGTESVQKASEAMKHAVAIAPGLADVRATEGLLLFYGNWNFQGAEHELRQAIQIDPDQALYHQWLARVLIQENQYDDAFRELTLAHEDDPYSIPVYITEAFAAGSARKFDRMLDTVDKLQELMGDNSSVQDLRGVSLWAAGNYEKAIAVWRKMAVEEGDSYRVILEDRGLKALRAGGPRAYALVRLSTIQAGDYRPLHPDDFDAAEWYAVAGEDAQAMAALEASYTAHDEGLLDLLTSPAFDRLRKQSEFQRLYSGQYR